VADRQDDVIARVNKVIYIRKMPNLEHKVFNKPWRAKNELWERRLAAIYAAACLKSRRDAAPTDGSNNRLPKVNDIDFKP